MRKLVVLVMLALGLLLLTPAVSSASTPTLKSLAKSFKALQKQVKTLNATVKAADGKIVSLQTTVGTQASAIATLQGKVTTQASAITTLQSVVGADASHGLRKSVADIAANPALGLSWLPTYLSLDKNAINGVIGPNIVFQGCNLQIKSTTSETDSGGLGNLIVGWDNEPGGTLPSPFRSGSNNLVCGDENNFTSYGCFVTGYQNRATGDCASVSGGEDNQATGDCASVSGGTENQATNEDDSVSGGEANYASGGESSVSGGAANYASDRYASVSGGYYNKAESGAPPSAAATVSRSTTRASTTPGKPAPTSTSERRCPERRANTTATSVAASPAGGAVCVAGRVAEVRVLLQDEREVIPQARAAQSGDPVRDAIAVKTILRASALTFARH